MTDVSIFLVTYNSADLLPALAESLDRSIGVSFEVLVVDNASRDDSAAWVRQHRPAWTLIENASNVGFGRANNQLISLATGRHVLLLNTDAFMAPDSLRLSLDYLEQHPAVGLVGVQLAGEDGVLQPSARYFPTPMNLFVQRSGLSGVFGKVRLIDDTDWAVHRITDCDWVPGCFYLIRGESIRTVGLFDPLFFLYYEEVDHCQRLKKAGYQVHCLPDTTVVHVGGASAKSDGALTGGGRQLQNLLNESELIYIRKHFGLSGLMLHTALQSTLLGCRWARAAINPAKSSRAADHKTLLALFWTALGSTRWGLIAAR